MRGADVATVVALTVLGILLLGLLGGGMMMGPGMMGWGGFGANPLWGVLMLLFWVLIIGGVALLVFSLFRRAGPAPATGGHALEILQERYARGEISREEYEQARRDLEASYGGRGRA